MITMISKIHTHTHTHTYAHTHAHIHRKISMHTHRYQARKVEKKFFFKPTLLTVFILWSRGSENTITFLSFFM